MWVQVIHGSNLLNMTVGARISPRVVNERFDLALVYDRDVPLPTCCARRLPIGSGSWALWWRHPGEADEAGRRRSTGECAARTCGRRAAASLTESVKAGLAGRLARWRSADADTRGIRAKGEPGATSWWTAPFDVCGRLR